MNKKCKYSRRFNVEFCNEVRVFNDYEIMVRFFLNKLFNNVPNSDFARESFLYILLNLKTGKNVFKFDSNEIKIEVVEMNDIETLKELIKTHIAETKDGNPVVISYYSDDEWDLNILDWGEVETFCGLTNKQILENIEFYGITFYPKENPVKLEVGK